MNDNQYVFSGFSPNSELENYAKTQFDRILELSPILSSVSGIIKRVRNNHYVCKLKILSNQGSFSSEASAVDPESALNLLEGEVLKKISRWHFNRFVANEKNKKKSIFSSGFLLAFSWALFLWVSGFS